MQDAYKNINDDDLIQHIVHHLRRARRLLFITGAGISAASGLPAYRGIGGLYDQRLSGDAPPLERLLCAERMANDPEAVWACLARIEQACRGARFNQAHQIIAEMQFHFDNVCVLTQNVDGLHWDAGSRNLIEIHGHIHHLRCTACDYRTLAADFSALAMPPHCPQCAAVLRPDIVLFGEDLPAQAIARLDEQLALGFDMVFSIGTSSRFPYIAGPVLQARRQGVPTVEINPQDTAVSHQVDIRLRWEAVAAMERIWLAYAA
ncbi:MAG: NAD-dependent protein deacylase [Pseudomonadota bacterium]|nr:NAD-dependent protein deacylase [Pseudomonadota bacterium]